MGAPRVVVVGDLLCDLLAKVDGDVRSGTDTFTPIRTTGAGDALCTGFLSAWLTGATPEESLRRGIGLAARAVEQVGGRPNE